MSTRHAAPPPINRWPFILGDLLLLAVAFGAVAVDETPPGLITIIIVFVCVLAGVALLIAPYLMQFEARVRLAEASIRDQIEGQGRRLVQTAEQLSNAVSRSQSTEEQAGQALGTLEELAEKLATQSDELAQTLARSNEREVSELKAEIDRLARERDQQFSSLHGKVASISSTIQDAHSATKLAISSHAKAVDDVHVRLDEVGKRVADISRILQALRSALPTRASKPAEAPHATTEHRSASQPHAAPAEPPPTAEPTPAPVGMGEAPAPTPTAEEKPRPKSLYDAANAHAPASTPKLSKPTVDVLELPLEDMPPPRTPMKLSKREAAGATSVVATAYIGIGNKLYVRGEGPGLAWERGVPMQFLAVGKWGWTTTEAGGPVTCRIFRNDETPMLDADVVIGPGEKAEITPRF